MSKNIKRLATSFFAVFITALMCFTFVGLLGSSDVKAEVDGDYSKTELKNYIGQNIYVGHDESKNWKSAACTADGLKKVDVGTEFDGTQWNFRVNGYTKSLYCFEPLVSFHDGNNDVKSDVNCETVSMESRKDIASLLQYVANNRQLVNDKCGNGKVTTIGTDDYYEFKQCVIWTTIFHDQLGRKDVYVYPEAGHAESENGMIQSLLPWFYTEIFNNRESNEVSDIKKSIENVNVYLSYNAEGSRSQRVGDLDWNYCPTGKTKLKKISSNSAITDHNNAYTLEGAVYGIYKDEKCTNKVTELTTGVDGWSQEIELRTGEYFVKEIKQSKGYKIDENVYPLRIESGKDSIIEVKEEPLYEKLVLEINKLDEETKENEQGGATLEGAQFTVNYYNGFYTLNNIPSAPTRRWIIETKKENDRFVAKLDEEHKIAGDELFYESEREVVPFGTITIEETRAPNGYLLEGSYFTIGNSKGEIYGKYITQIVQEGDSTKINGGNVYSACDNVIRGGVKLQKRDIETGEATAQGEATLSGAEIQIISNNENPIIVEGNVYNKNEIVKTLVTDEKGTASTKEKELPYGEYRLAETKAPKGYTLLGDTERKFQIREDGEIVDMTDNYQSINDQIKRGDIEGVKIGAKTHKRLSNVPFKITSKTTGESHIVVTNENGYFSTASSWNSHKNNTNSGETSKDGVWFGTSEPDDEKGALLFDTYEIEEMRCESNEEYELIEPFEIVISRENVTVSLGTLTDEYKPQVSVETEARGNNGKKEMTEKDTTIIDVVSVKGLEVGKKYKVSGIQMVKESGSELVINGKNITGETVFTAENESEEVQVEFNFDISAAVDKTLVTFEELYDITDEENTKLIAEHMDINNENQTVKIVGEDKKITTEETVNTPNTGDSSQIILCIVTVAISVAIAVPLIRRMKQ